MVAEASQPRLQRKPVAELGRCLLTPRPLLTAGDRCDAKSTKTVIYPFCAGIFVIEQLSSVHPVHLKKPEGRRDLALPWEMVYSFLDMIGLTVCTSSFSNFTPSHLILHPRATLNNSCMNYCSVI